MPSWLIALILAVGATAWSYNKLARTNGNANPQGNFMIACLIGAVAFLIIFSFMNMILNFDAGI